MISKLHYITQDLAHKTHAEQTEAACAGGVDWVQLRVKNQTDERVLEIALEVKRICDAHGATLIINDRVRVAKEVGAHGVHLGKTDMPSKEARRVLGAGFIIGGTANTLDDIRALEQAGVDYIGLGPFRFTETKKNLSPVLGLEGYRNILGGGVSVPVVAIGGIKHGDITAVMEAGPHGVALSSLINLAENPSASAKKVLDILAGKTA
ncbi:thiamine-phosphate synthase (plasmid) [Fulvitalea axinellae]|uniref:Thiamine-phosphate synthase n=1 Tax=Fulvitalea axinellae TaxID=1182444 RepID=A0AAU9DII0_9BACT|nr:thiamine-phosphate synthase [Fulvitalea axinellae]